METCNFCGEEIEGAVCEIGATLDGETIASAYLCPACKRAALRDGCFVDNAVGAFAEKVDNNLWCEFCVNCPCEDGCEIPSVFNCPSIRKAIAEETE